MTIILEPKTKIFNYKLEIKLTEQNINFTPALILNGKQFPKEYKRSNLVYFLDDLMEQIEINTQNEEIILN